MTLDPQIVAFAALAMAIGWTMTFSGLKKHALELKRRQRTCPSCGRQHQRRRLPRALEQREDLALARPRRLDERDVAELAAGARLLAVEMEVCPLDAQDVRLTKARVRSG